MARGDKGFGKAKARAAAGNKEQEEFRKKGERAGATGAPRLTRKDVRRAKRMLKEEES